MPRSDDVALVHGAFSRKYHEARRFALSRDRRVSRSRFQRLDGDLDQTAGLISTSPAIILEFFDRKHRPPIFSVGVDDNNVVVNTHHQR